MNKINLNDLLQNLPSAEGPHQFTAPKFADIVLKDQGQKISVLSKKKQLAIKRQLGYQMTKQEMDKWVGIIKINREKETLNFQSKQLRNLNVNFFPSQPISDLQRKIESKLQIMNVQSQKTVLQQQQAILQKVDPEQAKRRLVEARKHRTAIFYEEQKRRRIAKIKSKLYHKIKNRQKQREQVKKIDTMTPNQKNQYIEKLLKQRIKERITLRHSTKSKHIQNLLRFNRNEKNSVQNTINEINDLRHKNLEKLNEDMMQEVSEEYDDQNFREQAMKDLEEEIEAIQKGEDMGNQQGDDNLKDLKFIQNAKQKRVNKQKDDAYKLYRKLEKGKQLKVKDVNSDASEDEEDIDKMSEGNQSESESPNAQRKVFGKKVVEDVEGQNPHLRGKPKKKGQKNIENQLNSYLLLGGGDKEQNSQKNQILTKDINLANLQTKYQPDRVPIDLSSLIDQNKQIYQGSNEAILENIRDFQHEKMAQIQQEFNKQQQMKNQKKTKGWGSWAGPGISEKKVDPQEQLKKKLRMIEEIKRKRKDNSLAHVTINEVRNKQLSEYFVKELPHNFTNPDQFDFMQNQAIGPEWNSFNHFKDNIKPKVITKVGQVITPIKLPRHLEGNTKKKN